MDPNIDFLGEPDSASYKYLSQAVAYRIIITLKPGSTRPIEWGFDSMRKLVADPDPKHWFFFNFVKLKISFYSLFVGPVDNVPEDPTPVVRPALAVGCPADSTVSHCVVLAATIRWSLAAGCPSGRTWGQRENIHSCIKGRCKNVPYHIMKRLDQGHLHHNNWHVRQGIVVGGKYSRKEPFEQLIYYFGTYSLY